ncbi:MAG TPA: L-seryl-tRNA(Sec) selenium transferase [Methylomirabilota bacterium]|nr:L-seryl-tRNA(Sec) selenium transferase [Methylomirabilota bacterium]
MAGARPASRRSTVGQAPDAGGPALMAARRRDRLRALPSVDEVVRALDGQPSVSRGRVVEAVRAVLAERRRAVLDATSAAELDAVALETPALLPRVRAALATAGAWGLDRVVNATGVVLHTNLGRAPLGPAALARLALVAARYSNLELDVRTKARGSRYGHVDELLCRLSGAEASLVVNNNAAAVLLALESLARGREVVVSRGELIEIGGAFRIPDILARSGARLVEVGTTNRTRVADYASAITPDTALLLKVHPSNYRVVGFTESVLTTELAELGQARGLPVLEDLGSGCFLDLRPWGLPREPTVPETVAAGADVVTFSGDKLLGGPQAGIVVGRRPLVERLRQNPLNRALRIDKLTLAALEATLRAYEDPATAPREIPTLRMLSEPAVAVRRRAARVLHRVPLAARSALGLAVVAGRSEVGGGALPLAELPTAVLALGAPAHPAAALDAKLRAGRPPVIGRIAEDRLLLDCRTVMDDEVSLLAAALTALV